MLFIIFTQTQWNNINWIYSQITGTTLTSELATSIGWNFKTTITLEDWNSLAPNVTTIDGAFNNNQTLTSIIIPSSITTIGTNAFHNITALKTLTFVSNSRLTTIGENAFNGSGLTAVIIPNSVTTIGTNAFHNTTALKTLTFVSNSRLTTIGENAFNGSGLTAVIIPNAVTTIGTNAFANTTSLTNITMQGRLRGNNSVQYGFTQTQWNNINWIYSQITGTTLTSELVTSIGWNFKTTITLEDWNSLAPNVTTIDGAFNNNQTLTSIIIPTTITKIGTNSFYKFWNNNYFRRLKFIGT